MYKDLKNILKCYKPRYYSKTKSNKYTNTVILPKTKFPQKLTGKKLNDQNKFIFERCEFQELYSWQRGNLKGQEFVLHDGPPYANGLPHMGHVINKILKDIINRYHILKGQKVHYTPGWDCHGLPIELKAMKDITKENSPLYIRSKARGFATKTIKEQSKIFQSWGVIGDWEKSYKTYNIPYIQNQLRQFYKLYEKKLIYRDVKPVYWSSSSKTALAEAELEYNEKHTSTSAFVRFKVTRHSLSNDLQDKNLYALIWTTTPWTLPSNQAICYNPKLNYSLVNISDDLYIVATDLIEELSKTFNCTLKVLRDLKGEEFCDIKYFQPFSKEELPFLVGDHATTSKGTGLVHTAPAHGPEDFLLALKNRIPLKCIVDESGYYTDEAGLLKGLSVLSEGDGKVLECLKEDVLKSEEYVHSYPYDWRTKKPVIIRASQQWFIDTDKIKDRAIELVNEVRILPDRTAEIYKNNLITQLKKRPYWCISRQRVWGVPIPVIYDRDQPIITEHLTEHYCKLLEKHGSDFWWTLPISDLISDGISDNGLEKGQDIFDIWFDSGLSWSSVLGNDQIADMYLEGVDQFTGWFQSSLLTSVALRDRPPYKTIYVHGFAVDQNGHKMSKSLGNVVDPQEIIYGSKQQNALGIDTLRWWVACHASNNSTAFVSQNILQSSADEIQKIRNALRFAISVLDNPAEIPESNLKLIDQYLLHLTWEFNNQVKQLYEDYQFNKLCIAVINFVTNPVSALYYSIIKDRLYCNARDDEDRRSAQFVVNVLLDCISRAIAPIVPHLVEELHMYRVLKKHNTFHQSEPIEIRKEWNQPELNKIFRNALNIRRDIYKISSNPIDFVVKLEVPTEVYNGLKIFEDGDLEDLFQVADVSLLENTSISSEDYRIELVKTDKYLCGRCKKYNSLEPEHLCNRCDSIVGVSRMSVSR